MNPQRLRDIILPACCVQAMDQYPRDSFVYSVCERARHAMSTGEESAMFGVYEDFGKLGITGEAEGFWGA